MSVCEGFPGAGGGSAWLCHTSLGPCGPGEWTRHYCPVVTGTLVVDAG